MKSLWHSISLFVTVGITIVVASSYEGSDLPDDQVEQVLALYNRHCRSAYGLSANPGSNVHVVCKEGREDYGPPKKQVIKIPPGPPPKKNILFVEAPAYKIKHDITLIGEPVKPPRTVVYVLQNKNHHNFNFLYRNGPQETPKPQVYFLGNKAQGGSPPSAGGYPSGPVEVPSSIYGTSVSVATVNSNPASKPVGYPSLASSSQNEYTPSQLPSNVFETTVTTTQQKPTTENDDRPINVVSLNHPPQSQQSGRNEEVSLPGLGPEYELVPADPDTLSQYEKYFTHIQNGYTAVTNNRIKNHQSRSILSSDLPSRFEVRDTEEQQIKDKPEEAIKPFSQSRIPAEETRGLSSVQDAGNKASRIIFPEESIQQFQYSSPTVTEGPERSTEKPVTRKTISHLQRASLFKRKPPQMSKLRFPGETSEPEKHLLSYNDYYNYMESSGSQEVSSSSNSKENTSKKGRRKRIRTKSRSSKELYQQKHSSEEKAIEIQDRLESIASANSAIQSQKQVSSPFHAKLLLAFASQAGVESTSPAPSQYNYRIPYTTPSTTTPSPSLYADDPSTYTFVDNLSITGNSRNRKRSHSPAYEMIPASLISYSYTKVD